MSDLRTGVVDGFYVVDDLVKHL